MSIKADASKDMGQLLLQGWAMLAENCPTCLVPLMRDPKSKDRLCCNCSHVYKADVPLEAAEELQEEAQEAIEEPGTGAAGSSTQAEASAGAVGGHANHLASKNNRSEDISELLSDKMLQGWALLDKLCPRCDTPLVRSRAPDRKMFCVCCDCWVMTEAEAAVAGSRLSSVPPASPATSQTESSRAEGVTNPGLSQTQLPADGHPGHPQVTAPPAQRTLIPAAAQYAAGSVPYAEVATSPAAVTGYPVQGEYAVWQGGCGAAGQAGRGAGRQVGRGMAGRYGPGRGAAVANGDSGPMLHAAAPVDGAVSLDVEAARVFQAAGRTLLWKTSRLTALLHATPAVEVERIQSITEALGHCAETWQKISQTIPSAES